jgi:hypothetical protein
MQTIGDSTPTANASGEFTDGNPVNGTRSTLLKAAWLNTIQRELINAVEGLGAEVDPSNDKQLLEGIQQLADDISTWEQIKNIPPALTALSTVVSVNTSITLTSSQMGLVLIDAISQEQTITLPPSVQSGFVDVILRRVDNSGHRLVVQANPSDTIKFHTHLNPNGYPFFVLMGAGDWWHVRSDGNGSWWPMGRHDSTPLGRAVFETTTVFNPGGYGPLNGPVLVRTEWPWLWDHAQQSGMNVSEALRVGNEGGWTDGDGGLTFRGPEARAEFLRVLDENRGEDISRIAGSYQAPEIQSHLHDITMPRDWGATVAGNAVFGDQSQYGDQDISTALTGGNETRPRNIAYPGRIKLI